MKIRPKKIIWKKVIDEFWEKFFKIFKKNVKRDTPFRQNFWQNSKRDTPFYQKSREQKKVLKKEWETQISKVVKKGEC